MDACQYNAFGPPFQCNSFGAFPPSQKELSLEGLHSRRFYST